MPCDAGVDVFKALKIQLVLDESLQYPAVWFLSVAWKSIWESRLVGKRPQLYKVRADLEAKVNLLRETRSLAESSEKITAMISKL